jgi:hypothetical protein
MQTSAGAAELARSGFVPYCDRSRAPPHPPPPFPNRFLLPSSCYPRSTLEGAVSSGAQPSEWPRRHSFISLSVPKQTNSLNRKEGSILPKEKLPIGLQPELVHLRMSVAINKSIRREKYSISIWMQHIDEKAKLTLLLIKHHTVNKYRVMGEWRYSSTHS